MLRAGYESRAQASITIRAGYDSDGYRFSLARDGFTESTVSGTVRYGAGRAGQDDHKAKARSGTVTAGRVTGERREHG